MSNGQRSMVTAGFLILWGIYSAVAIAGGLFQTDPGEPAGAMALNLVGAAVVFLIACRLWPPFGRYVSEGDPSTSTALQSWRVVGAAFLFVMYLGRLPAEFALPAGIGDVLVGLAAPFVAARLRRGRLSRAAFYTFHALGLLDFVVAFAAGTFVATHPDRFVGFASMTAMPLVIIPAALVPAFTVAHLAALWQFRRGAAA